MDMINEDGSKTYNKGEPNERTVSRKGIDLKVTVDRSAEIEAIRQELENERLQKQDLESKLQIIAEKEFKAKKAQVEKTYGVLLDHITADNPEELVSFERTAKLLKGEKPQYQYTPMNPPDQYRKQIHISEPEEYESTESMIIDLQTKAKGKDAAKAVEVQAILNELEKKALKTKGQFNYELDSPLRTLALKPSRAEGEPLDAFNKRVADWKSQIKFRKIHGDE